MADPENSAAPAGTEACNCSPICSTCECKHTEVALQSQYSMTLEVARRLGVEVNLHVIAAQEKVSEAADHIKQAGELLIQAKAGCKHGEWLAWLKSNCILSPRQAQKYMRVAERWDILKASFETHLTLNEAIAALAEATETKPCPEATAIALAEIPKSEFEAGISEWREFVTDHPAVDLDDSLTRRLLAEPPAWLPVGTLLAQANFTTRHNGEDKHVWVAVQRRHDNFFWAFCDVCNAPGENSIFEYLLKPVHQSFVEYTLTRWLPGGSPAPANLPWEYTDADPSAVHRLISELLPSGMAHWKFREAVPA